MECSEVSLHEVKVFLILLAHRDKWLSNHEIVELINGVAPRTVRAKTEKLVKMQLLDQAEVFPSHRYRWSEKADKRNGNYLLRLKSAAGVFGLTLPS